MTYCRPWLSGCIGPDRTLDFPYVSSHSSVSGTHVGLRPLQCTPMPNFSIAGEYAITKCPQRPPPPKEAIVCQRMSLRTPLYVKEVRRQKSSGNTILSREIVTFSSGAGSALSYGPRYGPGFVQA